MRIPDRGLDRDVLLNRLESYRAGDVRWREGRTFAHVYDAGKDAEEIGELAYVRFLAENALDPDGFPSLVHFENDLVRMVATHLDGDDEVTGNFTSGGTESILLAVKAARDHARVIKPAIAKPAIVLPTTAHAAFHKAAHYLDLKTVLVDVDPASFRADPGALRDAITADTIMLVGSTPAWSHGVIDPIDELAAIANDKGLWLHVDACVGGFLLPYFRQLGEDIPPFGFSIPGVSSMSVDLHKYAFAPKGASLVLYRNRSLRKHQMYACAEWAGYMVVNPTVTSSRPGGPIAAAWAVVNRLGSDGYLALSRRTLAGAQRVRAGIESIDGLRILGDPRFCLFAVTSEELNVFQVSDELRVRGWHVQPQLSFRNSPANFHLFVTPGNAPNVDALLADLQEAVTVCREKPARVLDDAARAYFGSLTLESMDDAMIDRLFTMASVGVGEIPERMADVNELLDALPREIGQMMVTDFYNELYRHRG